MLLQYGVGVFFVVQLVKTLLLPAGIIPPQMKILLVVIFSFVAAWQGNTVPASIVADTAAIGAVAVLIHQGYRLVRVLGDVFRQRVMASGRIR